MSQLGFDPKSPSILQTIREEYLDREIVGEDASKQLLFLICCSTFTRNPLSAVVKGLTGVGKSNLVNRVLDIFRRLGIVIEFSRITGAYLENMASRDRPRRPNPKDPDYETKFAEYEEQRKKPRSIDLTSKIIYIDELRGISNSQAPKLLISEGRLRLGTIINQEPVEIEVKGTPTIITTTTLAALSDPEFENRVVPIQADETEEQTKRVLEHQARRHLDPAQDWGRERAIQAIVGFLNQLKPYDVANPYASKLAGIYPTKNVDARRGFPKLLSLTDVVTWLFQYQRRRAKKLLDIFLVTDQSDIDTVKALALAAFREDVSGISEREQSILDYLAEQKDAIQNLETLVEKPAYKWLTITEMQAPLRRKIRKGEQWIRDHVNRLVADGYVEKDEYKPSRFRFRFAELQPETLDIGEDAYRYSEEAVKAWADTYGYQLVESPFFVGKAITQGQPIMSPLERFEPATSPNSEFGHPADAAGEFGHGPSLNPLVALPTQNVDVNGITCPLCHTTYPDQPSYDNHLSTYKHD